MFNTPSGSINIHVIGEYKPALIEQTRILKRNCDFRKIKEEVVFFMVNSKKAPELADEAKDLQPVIETVQNSKYTEDIKIYQDKLNPIIARWKEKNNKLVSTDKNIAKLKFMYLYNSAVTEFFLEQYDEAIATIISARGIDYKSFEFINLKKTVEAYRSSLAKSNFETRHHNRSGFSSTSKFEFSPSEVKRVRKNPITNAKNDMLELGTAFKELGQVTYNAAQELEQGIQKGVLHIYGDSVNTRDHRFSKLSFKQDGVEYNFSKGRLKRGNGYISTKTPYIYSLNFYKPMPLLEKSDLFWSMNIDFIAKNGLNKDFNAENFKTLLKKYEGIPLKDISTGSKQDTVLSYQYDTKKTFPEISWDTYGKDLAIEVAIYYTIIGETIPTPYISTNGNTFTFIIKKLDPVKVDHGNGVVKEGYMATIEMADFHLTKYNYNPNSKKFNLDDRKFENISFTILIE